MCAHKDQLRRRAQGWARARIPDTVAARIAVAAGRRAAVARKAAAADHKVAAAAVVVAVVVGRIAAAGHREVVAPAEAHLPAGIAVTSLKISFLSVS